MAPYVAALILVDLVPGATGTQRLGWDISSFHIFQRFLLATVTGEVPMDFGPGCLTLGGGPVRHLYKVQRTPFEAVEIV